MGFAWDDDLVELVCPDGGRVWLKAKMSQGDEDAAKGAMFKISRLEVGTNILQGEFDIVAYQREILRRMVKKWDYTHNGKDVPVTPENIMHLDIETVELIMAEVNRLNARRTPDEGRDFTTAS